MPTYELRSQKTGRTYEVDFTNPPSETDIDEAISQFDVGSKPTTDAGYLSQLGSALSVGARQMASGVKATFNAATGDVADTAEAMAQMGALQNEQQANQSQKDIELNRDFAQNKAEYDKARGIFPTIGALGGYVGSIASNPGAAFKQAVQSAPNAAISAGTGLAGYALGGLLGAGAGIETGPGAILTGIAGAAAGGAVSNSLMEAGPAIYDILNERTNGAASSMTADQIAQVLQQNPDIMSEGLKTGAIRGSVIGVIEGLGMKGAGRLMSIPERAAARAAQKTLIGAGVDVASKEAVETALLDPALKIAVSAAAKTAKDEFTSTGNLARLAGASGLEIGTAGAGEVGAQVATGQEIDPTAAVQEMMGEVGLSIPVATVAKGLELARTPTPSQVIAENLATSAENTSNDANKAVAALRAVTQQVAATNAQNAQVAATPKVDTNLDISEAQIAPTVGETAPTEVDIFEAEQTPEAPVEPLVETSISDSPSPNLTPEIDIAVAPRPARKKGRDQPERDSWDEEFGLMRKGGRTHNDDGTPYQPTVLDEVTGKAIAASSGNTFDQNIDSFGVDNGIELRTALSQLLNDGWAWDDMANKMVNPANPTETPSQGLRRIRSKETPSPAMEQPEKPSQTIITDSNGEIAPEMSVPPPTAQAGAGVGEAPISTPKKRGRKPSLAPQAQEMLAKAAAINKGEQTAPSTENEFVRKMTGQGAKPNEAKIKRLADDLAFSGVGELDGVRYAIQASPDGTFYVQKTTDGVREALALGQPDIETANQVAIQIASNEYQGVSEPSITKEPATKPQASEPVGSDKKAEVGFGGMSVEEAKAYLNRPGQILGFDELSFLDSQRQKGKIKPAKPIPPTTETPTPATGGKVMPGGSAMERDVTKVEQMTPEERGDAIKADFANWGSFKTRKAAQDVLDERLKNMPKTSPMHGIAAEYGLTVNDLYGIGKDKFPSGGTGWGIGRTPKHEIAVSVQQKIPVSAAAVDTYGIKLPSGYQKRGELYIYQPNQANETAPIQSPVSGSVQPKDSEAVAAKDSGGEASETAKVATVKSTELRVGDEVSFKGNTYRVKNILSDGRVRAEFTNQDGIAKLPVGSVNITTLPRNVNFTRIEKQSPQTTASEAQTPATSRKVAGASGVAQSEPVEGSIPTVAAESPVTAIESTGKTDVANAAGEAKQPVLDPVGYGNALIALFPSLKKAGVKAITVEEAMERLDSEWQKKQALGKANRLDQLVYMANKKNTQSALEGGNIGGLWTRSDKTVAVSNKATPSAMAHEIGHAIMELEYANAPEATKKAIEAEYAKWFAEKYGKDGVPSVADQRRLWEWMTDADWMNPDAPFPQEQRVAKWEAYRSQFNEWFADETAKWAATRDAPKSLVDNFFSELAQKLKKLWNSVRGSFSPNETLASWLDSISEASPAKAQLAEEKTDVAKEAMSFLEADLTESQRKVWTPEMFTAAQAFFDSGGKDFDSLKKAIKFPRVVQQAYLKADKDAAAEQTRREAADAALAREVEKAAKEQVKIEESERRREELNLKTLNSLIEKTRTNVVQGAVKPADAQQAISILNRSGEIPNVLFTWIGTSKDFLADPANKARYPETWKAVSANSNIEGMSENGQPIVFTDNVGVSDLDRKLANLQGTTPEVAAVRRVILHENIHKGMFFLNMKEKMKLFQFLHRLYSPEELDQLAKSYDEYADWRTNQVSYFSIIEEAMTRDFDSMVEIPRDGIWAEFMQFLREIWQKITGKTSEPKLKDYKDVFRLIRNSLKNSEKVNADRLKNGGAVRMSMSEFISNVTPEQDAAYMAAVEAGDMETVRRMVDEAAKAAGYNRKLFHGTNATETVEGESTPGSTAAIENLKSLAERVGLREWYGATSVYQRLADNGQMGVTQEDAANAKKWQAEATGTYEPSREKLAFDVFSPPSGELELGVHLGNESAAAMFGEVFPFFANLGKPFRLPDLGTWNYQSVIRELRKRGVKISESEYDAVFNANDNNESLRSLLKGKGISSIVYRNEAEGEGDSFIAFDPEQIKSADAVVKDDSGAVIPLSRRFQSASNDIRFSKVGKGLSALFPRQSTIQDAYRAASQGQSSQFISLSDVFAKAKEANPRLTEEAFKADVMRLYDNGVIYLEGANSTQEAEAASLSIPGTSVGTAVRIAVPQPMASKVEYGSPNEAAFNSGAEVARNTDYDERDKAVRSTIRAAYDLAPKDNGPSVPLGQLFDIAKQSMPDLTEAEFSQILQDLYEDSGALLQAGESPFIVTTPDGQRAGSAIIMPASGLPTSAMASIVDSPATNEFTDSVNAINSGTAKAAFKGRQFKDFKPIDRIVKSSVEYSEVAIKYVNSLEEEGVSLDDIANSIISPSFLENIGVEQDLMAQDALTIEVRQRVDNAKRKERSPAKKKQLSKLSDRLSAFWQGVGSKKGQHLGQRRYLVNKARYSWMFIRDIAEKAMKEARTNILVSNFGDENATSFTQNSYDNADVAKNASVDDSVGNVDKTQDDIDLEAGATALQGKEKTLWEKFKDIIRQRGLLIRRLGELDAKSAAKKSISDSERNAISQMTREEVLAALEKNSKDMQDVYNEFVNSGRESTKDDRENMAKIAKKRADKGLTLESLDSDSALAKMLREINQARRGAEVPLKNPIPWRKLLSKDASTVEEYRQRIFDAISSSEELKSATPEQKARLADLFAEAWESNRKRILDSMLERMIREQEAQKNLSKEGAKALQDQRMRIVEDINLGVLDNDELAKIMAEKFGIKSEFTETEKEKIDALIDVLQDEKLNAVKRQVAAYKLLEVLQGELNVPVSRMLADFWVSSVLSGPNTIVSIGLAVASGMFELSTALSRVFIAAGTNQKQLPSELAGAYKTLARLISAYGRQANIAWQYLVSGDPAFLDPSMNDVTENMQWGNIGKSNKLAEQMAKSDKILVKSMGLFMRTVSRLLTALDVFNSGLTKEGSLSIVFRQIGLDPEKIAMMEKKSDLKPYKDAIITRDFGGTPPKTARDKALLNSYALSEMMAELDKLGNVSENANQIAMQGAMTLDPSGLGGVGYRAIRSLVTGFERGSDKFLKQAQRGWQDNDDRALAGIKLAFAYLMQFGAYNAANFGGVRFARFAGNKFNQGLSFIPALGFARAFEAEFDADRVQGKEAFIDMIRRNQIIGVMIAAAGYQVLKAITDEPDDEKRGWFINGGWGNLTPEKKQQKLAAGEKEYTIGIGDRVFNYSNWPISSILAAVGSLSDMIRFSPEQWKDKNVANVMASAAMSGAAAAADIPALSQFQELFGNSLSSKDPNEKRMERFAKVMSGYAGGFIPRFLKDIDYAQDPGLRKYETLWEKTASHIPVYRRYEGKEYYDILGQQIQRNIYPGSREFMSKPTDPVYKILGALNSRGIWLTPANAEHRMVGKGARRRKLTQEEADNYGLETGKGYKQMLLRYGQRALQMPTERARDFLLDKADDVRDKALKKVYRGYQPAS